jgi:hypothetical protein
VCPGVEPKFLNLCFHIFYEYGGGDARAPVGARAARVQHYVRAAPERADKKKRGEAPPKAEDLAPFKDQIWTLIYAA